MINAPFTTHTHVPITLTIHLTKLETYMIVQKISKDFKLFLYMFLNYPFIEKNLKGTYMLGNMHA